jgi:outer membrane protein OmpA-like peptidoglycan-associated protein
VLGALLVLAAVVIARQDLARLLFDTDAPSPSASASVTKPSPQASRAPARSTEERASPTANAPAGPKPAVTFDVVRIDPDASVFAGQAPPNSKVTVLANGQLVAETKADETGAWAAYIERDFAPAEYELSLRARSSDGVEVSGQRVRTAVAPAARTDTAPRIPNHIVARAAAPAPITFLYNDTSFTNEGRLAVARLAEYVISMKPKALSLTGHADERGSDRYNVELSRQRLGVVADYLRNRGFAGTLELIPKGSAEPYAGVDRAQLSAEQAFQLDRRVELRLAR